MSDANASPSKTTQQAVGVERVTDERLEALRDMCADPDPFLTETAKRPFTGDLAIAIDELLELRSLLAAAQWQPIESAPRDGRNILLCKQNASHVFMGAARTMGGTATYWFDSQGHMREPTHWQPLPSPPLAHLSGEAS